MKKKEIKNNLSRTTFPKAQTNQRKRYGFGSSKLALSIAGSTAKTREYVASGGMPDAAHGDTRLHSLC